jgi:hypothetical protein
MPELLFFSSNISQNFSPWDSVEGIRPKFPSEKFPKKKKKKKKNQAQSRETIENNVVIGPVRGRISGTQTKLAESNLDHQDATMAFRTH